MAASHDPDEAVGTPSDASPARPSSGSHFRERPMSAVEPDHVDRPLEREFVHAQATPRDTVERHAASTDASKASDEALQAMNEQLRAERRHAEEALHESERRLRALADVVPDLLWSSELDGANTWCNDRWTAYTGQTTAQARGLGWLDAIHPDDRAGSARRYREAVEQGRSLQDEQRIRSAAGDYRWHRVRAEPMRDEHGRVLRMFGAATDIHGLRIGAEALRASEERTRAIADELPGGAAFIVDRDLRYLFAGGEALHAAHLTADMFLGRSLSDVVGPEMAAHYEPHYRDALAGETFSTEHESHGRHYLTRGGPLRDAHGRVSAALAVSYDMTDRKRAEDAVRRSEERFRTLADAVPQIIWANDGRGTADYFNRRWYEYSGLSFEDSRGLGWEAIVHPDDAVVSKTIWRRALQAGEVFDREYRLRGGDGSYRWFIGRNVPVRDADGQITGWFGTATDIDDLKNAEAALRASHEQFRRAIEEAPIPMIMQAEDGQVLQISKTWTALTGYGPDDLPTLDARIDRAYGSGADDVRDFVHRLFGGDASRLDTEIDVATRTGERRRWSFSASAPGKLRDGRRFIVGMALDITERRQAEEALRESRERLQLIVENAREYAIFAMNLERRITSWNAGAQNILGYTQDEAIGELADIIFTPEDRAAGVPEREAAQAFAEDRASDERWHLRRDGNRFWGSGIMTVMHDVNGAAVGLVKIFRDQTAELHAKETLEQSRQQLRTALLQTEAARDEAQAAGKAKDRFLAVLSHELRTPLTPLLLAAQILARNKTLPRTVLDALAIVERNVRLETHLVDDLLDVTRISTGKMEISRQATALHEIVHLAVEVSAPDIEARRQRLTIELAKGDDSLSGDVKRLQQVFWNLLKNASKFTPEGGAISIRSRIEGDRAVVDVSDTGLGFEPQAAERIFAAFEQGSPHVTRQFGGLGLGLAIARASVAAHGGTIRAASPGLGQGATFTVELPLARR